MFELGVVVALLAYLGWKEYLWRKEKQDLMDWVKSKDAVELRDLKVARNTEIKIEPQKPSDFVPTDNLNDNDFIKAVKGEKVNFPL